MKIISVGEELEYWNAYTVLVQMQNGTATFKIIYLVPHI